MQLESFSGLGVASVEQDFYATVTKRKYPMKINKNKSFGKLKLNFVHLFFTHEPKSILQILHDFFKKELIPIRKGELLHG